MSASLVISNLHAGYGGKAILRGVDVDMPSGSALTVIGPNGSGKSTLLKAVTGLVRLSAGTIHLDGRLLNGLGAPARTRQGIAYVPQEGNVFRNLTVFDNLRLGAEHTGMRDGAGLAHRLGDVLDFFPELQDVLKKSAGLLSGGQRQMVAMASALMQSPRILVLDEPSAGLSPLNAARLFDSIRRIRETGVTMLLIEQNVKLGLSVADRGLVLVGGAVRRLAAASELAADGDLYRLFLGVGE